MPDPAMPDPARIVETPRLIMRPHGVEDFASSRSLWTDPVFMRYFGGQPMGHEDVWLRVLRYAGSWALLGYGFWAVFERETGTFVGEVGFHELQRATRAVLRRHSRDRLGLRAGGPGAGLCARGRRGSACLGRREHRERPVRVHDQSRQRAVAARRAGGRILGVGEGNLQGQARRDLQSPGAGALKQGGPVSRPGSSPPRSASSSRHSCARSAAGFRRRPGPACARPSQASRRSANSRGIPCLR